MFNTGYCPPKNEELHILDFAKVRGVDRIGSLAPLQSFDARREMLGWSSVGWVHQDIKMLDLLSDMVAWDLMGSRTQKFTEEHVGDICWKLPEWWTAGERVDVLSYVVIKCRWGACYGSESSWEGWLAMEWDPWNLPKTEGVTLDRCGFHARRPSWCRGVWPEWRIEVRFLGHWFL